MATVDNLPLVTRGDTTDEAESKLIRQVKNWVTTREENGTLERSLTEAGYDGFNNETEIILTFTDESS